MAARAKYDQAAKAAHSQVNKLRSVPSDTSGINGMFEGLDEEQLEAAALAIAAVLAMPPAAIDARLMQQIVLPVRKAGLQIDLPSRVLPMARAASLMEVGPALRLGTRIWRRC